MESNFNLNYPNKMLSQIDFKGQKMIMLSIVMLMVVILWAFFGFNQLKSGNSFQDNIVDWIIQNAIKSPQPTAPALLKFLWKSKLGDLKFNTDEMIYSTSDNYESLALNEKTKDANLKDLFDNSQDTKIIAFGNKLSNKTYVLKRDGTGTLDGNILNKEDLKTIGKDISTIAIGSFSEKKANEIINKHFPRGSKVKLDEDKYLVAIDMVSNGNSVKLAQTNTPSSPTTPPVITPSRVIIPATLLINGTTYNLKHAGEELSNSNKDQILEENVPNGKKQTNITLSEGASHNVVGTINNIDLICNTGYFKYYNTDSNQDVCEEEYIIPGTLNIGGKTYTIAKAGERLTPANNQSAGTAPTPDNKGTIHADIGLTKWPSKTVVGNILSQNITCQTGYVENNGGCVKQETPYTLPNAYVWPVTGITFNLTSACAWKTITASSGKQVCNATVRDFGGATKTFNNSLEITVDTNWVPTVVFKNDVEKTFTVPNTITAWGHTWKVNFFSGEKMTNKWYGKFRNSSMAVSVSNPWGLERAIPNGKILSNYDFTLHVDGTVDKTLNTTNRVICNPNFKAQGSSCVEDWGACPNPIYLDTNGVTVKAKACAEAGKTYQWNGDNWYVARDKNDAKSKIFINNSDKEGKWTFKANRIVTSKVTSMSYMFNLYSQFNQPIGNWDTSNVTSMAYMFSHAKAFNQNISSWNTWNVDNMNWMFYEALNFNKPLNNWDVGKVVDMGWMFHTATNFNQPLNNWNTHKVINMQGMFHHAEHFNQPLNHWNVSQVKNMDLMFDQALVFNGDISSWNTGNVENMGWMFSGAIAFNQPIWSWNTSKVTDMSFMFASAFAFNKPLKDWDTKKVTTMERMFNVASSFNQPIWAWNVSNVLDLREMFKDAASFDQNLSSWRLSHMWVVYGATINDMFSGSPLYNKCEFLPKDYGAIFQWLDQNICPISLGEG